MTSKTASKTASKATPKITWAEPPKPARASDSRDLKYEPFFRELAKHPGRWARIFEGSKYRKEVMFNPSQPMGISLARRGIDVTCYQTSSRKREDGLYDTYIRYVGPTK